MILSDDRTTKDALLNTLGEEQAARALQFTILTVARSGETLGMTWDEVDFGIATWVVPASRMKMQKEHAVPLSEQAVAILRAQEAERGNNPHIFAGRPQRPLSGMAMSVLLRRMNVDSGGEGRNIQEFDPTEVTFKCNIRYLIRGGARWIRTRDISNRTA